MKKTKKIPQRKCINCGNLFDKNDLLRVVNNKELGVVIDESGKLNGRGAYICKNSECLWVLVKFIMDSSANRSKIDATFYFKKTVPVLRLFRGGRESPPHGPGSSPGKQCYFLRKTANINIKTFNLRDSFLESNF